MKIRGLMMDPMTNLPVVILKEACGNGILPIWVGVHEANAIALEIERVVTPRPMTHDLLKNVLLGLQAHVQKVVVTGIKGRNVLRRHLGGPRRMDWFRSIHVPAMPSRWPFASIVRSSWKKLCLRASKANSSGDDAQTGKRNRGWRTSTTRISASTRCEGYLRCHSWHTAVPSGRLRVPVSLHSSESQRKVRSSDLR